MLDMKEHDLDVVIVGGGLQGGLLALATLGRAPRARLAVIEAGPRIGGNHTWCFHAGDLSPAAAALVEPLVEHRWEGYDVLFPRRERTLGGAYTAVTSERFADVVEAALGRAPNAVLLTGAAATSVQANRVELADGQSIDAKLVIDARGPERFESGTRLAYQKFLGLELELEAEHGLERPILMDARVPQSDGFRFFYVLPLDAQRVLVEDTYYSDTPSLDIEALRGEVLDYARARGLRVAGVVREESGVLPIPTRSLARPSSALPLQAGYRGGWFHPTTGYSLPWAARLALHVAESFGEDPFGPAWDALTREHHRQQRFSTWLNRLLFGAFRPEDRWNVLERFYGLPEPTIRRFYAMNTTATDRARVLLGRPPRGLSIRVAFSNGAAP